MILEPRAILDPPVSPVQLDNREIEDPRVLRAALDLMVNRVITVHLELQALKVHREITEAPGLLALQVSLVKLVYQVVQASLVPQVAQGNREGQGQ